jgi:PAS domain S-box-containing protein
MIFDLSESSLPQNPDAISDRKSNSLLKKINRRIYSEPARLRTDVNGFITWVNPAFTRLCGHTFSEMKGRKPGSLLQGPKSSPESIEILRHAIRHGVPCVVELVNYHKNNIPYRVRISLRPLLSESCEIIGFEAEEYQLA